jgi:hypothetical protein
MKKGAMALLVPLVVALLLSPSSSSSSSSLAMASGPVQSGKLDPHFYDASCPHAQHIVASIVGKAHYQDPRMAASLLRLHFHDCFVKVPIDRAAVHAMHLVSSLLLLLLLLVTSSSTVCRAATRRCCWTAAGPS